MKSLYEKLTEPREPPPKLTRKELDKFFGELFFNRASHEKTRVKLFFFKGRILKVITYEET